MVKLFKGLSVNEIEDKINNFIKQNYDYPINNLMIYPLTNTQKVNYVAYIEYCRNREEEFDLWKE